MLRRAFSLVELMVTLIIVSCITAALAPVITKKLKSSSITIEGSGKGLSMNCDKFGESCALCEGNRCVSCAKSCTENQALDVGACQCVECNSEALHGASCLKCDIKNCSKCIDGYYLEDGICKSCTSGNSCDGTNTMPCPKGYYCADGVTNECPPLTYNNTESATNSSACRPCTPNCSSCDKTTGECSGCSGDFELLNDKTCGSKKLSYTYTGAYTEGVSTTGKQKIYLKSNGTLKAARNANISLLMVGGGGSGSKCTDTAEPGGGGGGGRATETAYSLIANTAVNVVIGGGGSPNGGSGGTTRFGSLSSGGGGGGGCMQGGTGQGAGGVKCANAQNGYSFDGQYYGGGGGGGSRDWCGAGKGGAGGGGNGGCMSCNGNSGAANTGGGGGGAGYHKLLQNGGYGGSGIVIIIVN